MKVDDKFHGHPKVLELFNGPCAEAAVALWTLAGSWCSDQLTDGFVPVVQVRRLGFDLAAAEELVRVRLWHRVDGGFEFHEWTRINPSRAKVERERERGRERAEKSRSRRGVQPNPQRTFAEASAEASANVRPNSGDLRPNGGPGSGEAERDRSEASGAPTSDHHPKGSVRPNPVDVRTNIPDVHPTRPDPDLNPLSRIARARSREGRLNEHDLFNGYRERWQRAFPDAVPDGHSFDPQCCADAQLWRDLLAKVRQQADLAGRAMADVAGTLLDGFFADEWARERQYPPKLLISKFARYAAAVTSTGAVDDLRAQRAELKRQRDEAWGRGEQERVRELERAIEKLSARIRKAVGRAA